MSSKAPKPERTLTPEIEAAIASLYHDRSKVTFEMTRWQAFCLLGCVQLASRHPKAKDSGSIREAVDTIKQIQNGIGLDPIMAAVARDGWDTEYDA